MQKYKKTHKHRKIHIEKHTMRKDFFFVLTVVTALLGCSSKAPIDPRVQEVANNVTSSKTDFDNFEQFIGPKIPLKGVQGFAMLRSWKKEPDAKPIHQLYVKIQHEGRPKEFHNISLRGGDSLALHYLDQGPNCIPTQEPCGTVEDVGARITHKYLKNIVETGADFRFNARRGEDLYVSLPAYYVQGYLSHFRRR